MTDHLKFLDTEHRVYRAWMRPTPSANGLGSFPAGERAATELAASESGVGAWERNERRLRGGDEILDELRPFAWEPVGGDHYAMRQAQATYLNFPDMLVTAMVGHLLGNAPRPGKGLHFGSLGTVDEEAYDPTNPSRAEQIWYNCDGVGNDGSEWNAWWGAREREAMATGHLWMMVEAGARPNTREDELRGARPYLVSWKPQDVTNWHFSKDGRLAWVIVRPYDREPTVVDGELKGNDGERGYLLMVRRGVTALGAEFAGGGWWRYDGDKRLKGQGTWDATLGDIPMWPHFYQRDGGSKRIPSLSRPAITELGQAAVSYMNLSSARDFDAWDAATSLIFLLGVDQAGHNLAVGKMKAGNRVVPVPRPEGEGSQNPTVSDGSQGAVTGAVFSTALTDKREEARELAAREATSAPESSGESKRAGFDEVKAPRLVAMGTELQRSQNNALYFFALRWGVNPDGYTQWPQDYDIAPLVDDIAGMFDLQDRAGLKSPTLGALLLRLALKEKGLAPSPEDLEVIEGEWITDALAQQAETAQAAALAGTTVGGGE